MNLAHKVSPWPMTCALLFFGGKASHDWALLLLSLVRQRSDSRTTVFRGRNLRINCSAQQF
jgi:hypothetical protein